MTERDHRTAEEDRRIIVQRASFRVAMLDVALYAVKMAVPGLEDEVGRRLATIHEELEEVREKSARIANWWVEDERMTPLAVLLLMILAHVIEDFHLQGRMAEMKQKEWWYGQFARISARQSDRDMSDIMATYGRDYVPVLLLHGVEWAICVTIPVMLYCGTILLPDWYCVAIIVMAMLHAAVDHMKCNLYLINLNADQAVHIAQVVALWMLADLI